MTSKTSPVTYRIDAPGKVTGATRYPGDIHAVNGHDQPPLYGKILFSDQPHARLISINLDQAWQLPGVVAIFTAADVPVNEYGLIIPDQPVLVGLGSSKAGADISRWEADQVAVIVAETEEIAALARSLIQVEWQPLPVLTDVWAARQDRVLIHPEQGSNILKQYHIRKGDMATGWGQADVVITGDYYTPYQEHAYLQPEAGLSYIDEQGRVTVEIAGQWTHEDQHEIAHTLNLPLEQVRVIYPAIGGAFGGREDMSLQIVLALAAWRLHQRGINRTVRIVWSREESIVGHHKRHPAFVRTKWGATKEGKVVAVEAEMVLDAGGYAYTSTKVLGNAHLSVTGPYEIPHAHIDSYAVYTNNVPSGAFRGFGGPQGAFVAETQMNKLAAALGMDPVALRLQNCLREGSLLTTNSQMPASVSMASVITQCAQAAQQPLPLTTPAYTPFNSLPSQPSTLRRGHGFACAFKNVGFSFGFPERCEATIELYGKGEIERVILRHAGAEVGQGAHTVFRQMAAQALQLAPELISLELSDTASSGDSGSASASRMTFMAGNAIRGAAELALAAWQAEDRPAIGHYRYRPRTTSLYDPQTGVCDPNITYGYVAQAVDLVVDIETGHIHLERVICADDVGHAFNPILIEGQIEGAIVQALGYAAMEHLQLRNGRILNPYLSSYLIPGIMDVPDQVQSLILEIPDPQGPWGARGMAEMPFLPLAPAIVAALYDATGVWFDQLPLTPDRLVARLS